MAIVRAATASASVFGATSSLPLMSRLGLGVVMALMDDKAETKGCIILFLLSTSTRYQLSMVM